MGGERQALLTSDAAALFATLLLVGCLPRKRLQCAAAAAAATVTAVTAALVRQGARHSGKGEAGIASTGLPRRAHGLKQCSAT